MNFSHKLFFTFLSALLLVSSQIYGQQTGHVTYTLQRASSPTADQQDAYARIEAAMDEAVNYYNTYTSITKALTIQYNTGVATADGNFNGTIRFGQNRSYMVVLTALHEIAHTIGVGTTSEYRNLIVNGVFTGTRATAVLRELTGDPEAVLKGDQQHFWPYGLNYASEYTSDDDYVYHCKIVNGIYQDMFNEEVYLSCYLRSVSDGTYMADDGNNQLVLVDHADAAALVRLIALGDTTTFRLEFGDNVLDIPDESRLAGVAAGLWTWNGGNHQQAVFEFDPVASGNRTARIRMVHSNLYLRAEGSRIVQDDGDASGDDYRWEIVEEGSTFTTTAGRVREHAVVKPVIGYSQRNARLTVSSGMIGTARVLITDLCGRQIWCEPVNGTTIILTSGFVPGMYFVTVRGVGSDVGEPFVVR